ncbi:TolC family protein [Arsenicibacter rosenii]|uniref:Transporter n=1 Tax=Arsenicibacter rosenii TaxID=1750698 RepID=A0A1S2VCI9_9BACT|nr:TolC family protein [Arsenicibacter rosenii]OIN56025.1 hypothetical protein BLX24_27150 [Arsenicibacter rosenii]
MKLIQLGALIGLCSSLACGQTPLSLQTSKELALKQSASLKNSALETEAAKAVKKSAFMNYLPKVSAQLLGFQAINPLVSYQMPGGNLPVYDGNPANLRTATQFAYFPGANIKALQRTGVGFLTITQPLYAGGRIQRGNELAQLGVNIKENQQRLTRDEVLLKTEQQYWQLVSLQEKHKTIARYEALLASVDKQVTDAFQSGLIVRNDVLKVQLKKSELQANKNKLNSGHQLALRQFCHTLGLPYDSTLVVSENLDQLPLPQSMYANPEAAVANRTACQLLEQAVKATQLQTRLKAGETLPQAAIGLAGYQVAGLMKGGSGISNGLLYATVSIPISDWWTNKYAVKEQQIREQIAENTLNDTKGLLRLQTEKAWVDVVESYRQISVLEQAKLQATEHVKVSQSSYASGLITISDLLEAQALLTEAADKLIEAKTQYQFNRATYSQLTNPHP